MSARALTLLVSLCLLVLVPSIRATGEPTPLDYPHERTKDLSPLYGRYEIYEADEYRGSWQTTAADAQSQVGQELIVTAALFRFLGERIENPTYTVWFYPAPLPLQGWVPKNERWSRFYYSDGGQADGDEIIKVYRPRAGGLDGPWYNLEVIGTNELWVGTDGWYYKARKTDCPVLSPGHADYCQVMGPCSAGQGACDSTSECHSGLTCVEHVCQ